jgi:predicted enzyme related to lactoylglutathione lyase
MAETIAVAVNRPIWVDLASSDPVAAQQFYGKLFGWNVEVSPDPQYGGYGVAKIDGKDVAGIGGKMMPEAPTAWSVYIGSNDADAVVALVQAAGGAVIAPPMAVGDQGRMAVFTDPAGAFISIWQPETMMGFISGVPGTFAWAELNARGLERAVPFYRAVFGWEPHVSPMGDEPGAPMYTEFHLGEKSIGGGTEINPMVPADVPSYWLAYFSTEDVDATQRKAIELGATELLAPRDFAGGRFGVLSDPEGAVFGLLKFAR